MENEGTEQVTEGAVETTETTGTKGPNYEEQFGTDKELQSFVDKKVTQGINTALEKARKQWEIEQDNQKSEAEKLANMTEKQKQEYELRKANSERDNALNELNAYKLKEQAQNIANEKGVDSSLLSFIDFRTIKAEEVTTKIEELSNLFNKAVEKAVNDKLKEKSPISQNGTSGVEKKIYEIPNMY